MLNLMRIWFTLLIQSTITESHLCPILYTSMARNAKREYLRFVKHEKSHVLQHSSLRNYVFDLAVQHPNCLMIERQKRSAAVVKNLNTPLGNLCKHFQWTRRQISLLVMPNIVIYRALTTCNTSFDFH